MAEDSLITFVIGAGAGVPYGLPTGQGLIKKVIEFNQWITLLHSDDRAVDRQLFNKRLEQDARELSERLKLSAIPSIDAFIENHPKLSEIARWAIAAVLLQATSTVFNNWGSRPQGEQGAHHQEDDDWISWLLYNVLRPADEGARKRFAFVVFNYDHLFELALMMMLANGTRMTDKQASEWVGTLNIVHVYGELTAPRKLHSLARRPIIELTSAAARHAAKGIKVMNDERVEGEEAGFLQARQWIARSKKLVFLGFGFDETNLKRLGLDAFNGKLTPYACRVIATGWGLERQQRDDVDQMLNARVVWGGDRDSCLKCLKSFIPRFELRS